MAHSGCAGNTWQGSASSDASSSGGPGWCSTQICFIRHMELICSKVTSQGESLTTMTCSSAVLVGSLIKLWNNLYGNKSELNGGAQQPLLCFTCCEHDVLNFLLPSQINDREAELLKSFPYTCSLSPLHSYSDNKEKLLQQLQKYQSFKARLELTLLPPHPLSLQILLFSCVTCTLKCTVMDDSNLSQPHSRSTVCTGNVYSRRFCWRCSS